MPCKLHAPLQAAAKPVKAPEAPAATLAGPSKVKGRAKAGDQAAAELQHGQDCCGHTHKASGSNPHARGKRGSKAAAAAAKAAAVAAKAAEEEPVADDEDEEAEAAAPVQAALSPADAKKARRQRMMQRMGLAPVAV